MPVQKGSSKTGTHKLAEATILQEFHNYSRNVEVEVLSDNKCTVYVPESDIAKIIGKQGANITKIEEKLGIGIDIKSIDENMKSRALQKTRQKFLLEIRYKKNQLMIELGVDMQNRDVDIYIGEEFLLSAKAGKTGVIKIKKNNNIGGKLVDALNNKSKIRMVI